MRNGLQGKILTFIIISITNTEGEQTELNIGYSLYYIELCSYQGSHSQGKHGEFCCNPGKTFETRG